jgi:hypothetical protein
VGCASATGVNTRKVARDVVVRVRLMIRSTRLREGKALAACLYETRAIQGIEYFGDGFRRLPVRSGNRMNQGASRPDSRT